MNTTTGMVGVLLLAAAALVIVIFGPRASERRATTAEVIIRGFYRVGRFFWALAVGVEAGYQKFREERDRLQIAPGRESRIAIRAEAAVE